MPAQAPVPYTLNLTGLIESAIRLPFSKTFSAAPQACYSQKTLHAFEQLGAVNKRCAPQNR